MLRWGILGTSAAAGRDVAPALRACGHDLAVVGSRSRSRAQQFAASQGIRRARPSYDEVLAADDVDCVYVPLPNALHEEWAIRALQAGKHVLCPTPMATSADGTRRMAAAAATAGRVLMEGVWARTHPRTDALMEMVREGDLGPLRTVTATFGAAPASARDIRFDPALGGGALLDTGSVQVAMTRWLVGESPDGVCATSRLGARGVDLATAAAARFPSGVSAAWQAALDVAGVDQLTVAGTHATVRLPAAFAPPPNRPAVLERGDGSTVTFAGDGIERAVQRFAAAVVDGKPAPLSADDAIATAEVLDRLRAASG